MTLATVAETAALAGLPAQPAAHGLPGAAARHRYPTSDQLSDRHHPPIRSPSTSDSAGEDHAVTTRPRGTAGRPRPGPADPASAAPRPARATHRLAGK